MPHDAGQFIDTQTPEPLRKVRPVPGFEEYAPEAAFGGGKEVLGREIGKAAELGGALLAKHQNEATNTKLLMAINKAKEAYIPLMYGDNGFATKQANDVLSQDYLPKASDTFQKVNDSILADKTLNLSAKESEMLGGALSNLHTENMEILGKRMPAEIEKVKKTEALKSIEALTTETIYNPDTAEKNLAQIRATESHFDLNGRQGEANFQFQRIGKLLEQGDKAGAEKILQDPSTFLGGREDDARKMFDKMSKVINVNDSFKSIVGSSADEKEAMKKVNDITDPGEMKKVRPLVSAYFQANEKAIKDVNTQKYQNLSEQIGKNQGSDPTKMAGFASLPDNMQQSLIRQADPSNKGDVNVSHAWNGMASDKKKSMSDDDFFKMISDAPMQDRSEMWKERNDLLSVARNRTVNPKTAVTDKELQDALLNVGLAKSKNFADWNTEQIGLFHDLRESVVQEITDKQLAGEKDVDPKKVVQEQLLAKYHHSGFLGLTENQARTFQMKKEDIPIGNEKDSFMTEDEASKYSESQLIRMYQAYVRGDNAVVKAISTEGPR